MAALSLIHSGACLDDDTEIPRPSAQDLLRIIAERGDVIAQRAGRVFLLVDLEAADFDQLAGYRADGEDLEDDPDDDGDAEPSLAEVHALDLHRVRGRSPP